MALKKSRNSGFTIVELLVVIVVIGILAAITIISYTGINQKAIAASLQSDLTGAANQLKMYYVDNGVYPSDLVETGTGTGVYCPTGPADTRYCIKASPGNVFLGYGHTATTFALDAQHTSSTTTYHITNDTAPVLVDQALSAPDAPTVSANTVGDNTTWSWPNVTCSSGSSVRYHHTFKTDFPGGDEYDTITDWIDNGSNLSVQFNTMQDSLDSGSAVEYTVQVQAQCYKSGETSGWSASGSDVYNRPEPVTPVPGCMDSGADNYDPSATYDDGTCSFSTPTCNIDASAWGLGVVTINWSTEFATNAYINDTDGYLLSNLNAADGSGSVEAPAGDYGSMYFTLYVSNSHYSNECTTPVYF